MKVKHRYFIKYGLSSREQEVTKAEFVDAERAAGFVSTTGTPNEPATGGFIGSDGTRGRIKTEIDE